MDDHDEDYELVMPFVVCKSQGGPYEDDSFSAGYALGWLDSQFENEKIDYEMWRMMRTESMPQVDLVALRHGATTEWEPSEEYPEWSAVKFHKNLSLEEEKL